jgi:DnaK suppressor protein
MTVFRYSDEDLNEFRSLVESKLADTLREYNSVVWQMHHNATDEAAVLRDELYIRSARLKRYADNLRSALLRIDNGTYGICIVSGTLIPRQRLLAVPHTTINTDARLQPLRIGA